MVDEQWYDEFKGTELKSLFKEKSKDSQNLSNFARIKYESDSDGSQIMTGKKRKRKRLNSGSTN